MDYKETLTYIQNTPKFSKILGNDDLKKLLSVLGNPQSRLSFIHIAGTNGKGSTAAMIASILESSGMRTGLYTSPFIEVFNERIQVDGENIPDSDLARIATLVKSKIDELSVEISVFAQITAMAFLYFSEQKCDIVVLEAGLGGRLDATNVVNTKKVCVITKIGLDHTEYLGDTVKKIASEKCGIIQAKVPVVTPTSQDINALGVIQNFCKKLDAPLICASPYDGELSLSGDYQKANAGTAQKVAELMEISPKDIKDGLLNTRWIARFEYLRDNLILDGAHNPDGISALISSLTQLKKPVIFVVAMMEDKNLRKMAAMLFKAAKKVVVTEVNMPRCKKASALAEYFPDAVIEPDSISAVKTALSLAGDDELVCICGSLYLAGEVRRYFLTENH